MLQIARAVASLGHDVHVLSLNPRKQRADPEEARRVMAPIVVDAVDVDTSAVHALRAIHVDAPPLVARFFTRAFADAARNVLQRSQFDIVQIESPFLLPYVPAIRETTGARVVLRSLNVEFRIWEQLAGHATNFVRRAALRALARSLRRYEVAHLDTCDAIVPITEEDARDFRALGCTVPMHVLPGGVDVSAPAAETDDGSVAFLGSLDYRPNQEAALWIAEELWPRMRDVPVHVGGSNAPGWLQARMIAAGLPLEARIADATQFLQSKRAIIAPVFSGGGMRIKILEAMALAKPVVATTLAAAGIDVTDGENIVLADDADSFASAVKDLVRDPSRARAIGEAARRFVAARYDIDVLARDLVSFYEQLTNRRKL
jgi:glycosyltransferase involved in cell wall biosynthesis